MKLPWAGEGVAWQGGGAAAGTGTGQQRVGGCVEAGKVGIVGSHAPLLQLLPFALVEGDITGRAAERAATMLAAAVAER